MQLCSKGELYEYLIKIAKAPRKVVLTDSLMETLSIIAYKQPITRLEIEKIRGVSCDHAINRLLEYELITEGCTRASPIVWNHGTIFTKFRREVSGGTAGGQHRAVGRIQTAGRRRNRYDIGNLMRKQRSLICL